MASLIRTPHAWTDARLRRAAAGLITAALVIGCGDDTTGDATSDSATTNSSATGMTTDTTAGTSSGDTSGGPGGSETAGMTSSTSGATATDATTSGASETDPNSTGVTTGVTTVETTDGTGEPTTGDATTGGGGGQCGVADGDYGPCDAIIGWAFTGTTCELLSGCDCGDDCDLFFDNEIDCAKTCADAGECDEDKLFGVALADDLTLGGFCDQVDVCTPQQYSQLLPDLFPEQFVCEPGQFCPNQQETCTVSWAGEVTEELWTQLCAASLLPGLSTINCVIWGP